MQQVNFVAFNGMQALDVVGPLEVFSTTNLLCERPRYQTRVLSLDGRPVRTSSGLQLEVDGAWNRCPPGGTVIVPGGHGVHALLDAPQALAAVKQLLEGAERIASVCTGAFLLARLGLLDGRSAVTHWARQAALAAAYPAVTIEPDVLYTRDGVWTSAGITAGMDMALAMVEEDTTPQIAHESARWLVLSMRRDGDDPQLSGALQAAAVQRRSIARAQSFIVANPAADLRLEALAQRTGMSLRNFTRSFAREVGVTPAEYVRTARVRHARGLLARTDLSLDAVASRSGLGSRQTLQRAFSDTFGEHPSAYRTRIRTGQAS